MVIVQAMVKYAMRQSEADSMTYVYEVSSSPNMVLSVHPSRAYASAWALGGVMASQVHRVAARLPGQTWESLFWVANPEYDPAWDQFHTAGWQPQLSGFLYDHPIWYEQEQYGWTDPPAVGITRRAEAYMFMNSITRNEDVRRMLNWRGTLPLLESQPQDMDDEIKNAMALAFPWETVEIPEEILQSITIGRMTNEECIATITAIFNSFWITNLGMHHKRSASLEGKAGKTRKASCGKLLTTVRHLRSTSSGRFNEAEVCKEFSRLKFQLSLADKPATQTDDLVFLELPVNRKVLLVEKPGPGYKEWHELNISAIFGKETIRAEEISYIEILSSASSYPFKRQAWTLKGMPCACQARSMAPQTY
ncbi:hypothetical protein CDD82_7430 [Ophiocordyceps australis]|uniref:Uncharacterized protein n=1 Tax=Ophiocordyceps australis TaxID=1399860 RepID=A0A2C5YRI1_9HYPO|nr:hypothetical protein CDD82_7430 [Ophiocordyceps australis]